MQARLEHMGRNYLAQLDEPLDISMPLDSRPERTKAWGVSPVNMEPVKAGNWIGRVKEGGSVNFYNVFFNPHGHGTHTEGVGHIHPDQPSVNGTLKRHFFIAELITLEPEELNGDRVLTFRQLRNRWHDLSVEALVIRHTPNPPGKLTRQYTGTNPPYLEAAAAAFIREAGVQHLLIDLPSVDREEDGGALAAHRAFWNFPDSPRFGATITELIYVPDPITDGKYLLNLQTAPLELDATPSRPVLYRLETIEKKLS